MTNLRNIAIIAHVDHGKTTLVDALLRGSGVFRINQKVNERALDSNELERERGITILAKCTSVNWGETRINIVDTPGHADFGGEVERILSMVDGVLLLVDASEGPMPQTKFVTAKALNLGLRPIVVVNKIDRPDARAYEVQDEVFELFTALDASDEQLDFPTIFASAKEGWAGNVPDSPHESMSELFKQIIDYVPAPDADVNSPFRMLVTTMENDPFLGRILTGRVESGSIKPNVSLKAISREGRIIQSSRVTKLLAFRGLLREPIDNAAAGDIIAIAGFDQASVADTLAAIEVMEPLPSQPIDPPTIAMIFSINDSPLSGRDGDKVTSRMIRDRLMREAEGNVAIRVSETDNKDSFEVSGRGELQLGVLIETMRREGFELSVSRPKVLNREDPVSGRQQEPVEEVLVDVDEEFSGVVVESMSVRKGRMIDMRPSGGNKTRLKFIVPSRGLIGYHGDFLTETRGTGVISRVFHSYEDVTGSIPGRRTGVLISNSAGKCVPYALQNLEERGSLMIKSGAQVYSGMVIGEHSRGNDLEVNPIKTKQLTNFRASGKDDAVILTPPKRLNLEQAIAYINDDELVEITPNNIRLRKRYLDPHIRKRARRGAEAENSR